MEIIIPILICAAIAIICAIILTVTSIFFSVKEDEKTVAIRNCLAGANCGACGYSGCDGYAKALSDGSCEKANLCTPGGDESAKKIAKILGVDAEDVVEMVAYVSCGGNCEAVERRYEYKGPQNCYIANMNYSGDKMCTFACLGYGDCAAVCPNDAIVIENGVAKILEEYCIGCGICQRTCPNGIIQLIRRNTPVAVTCSNHDKGVTVKKYCSNGCIGCGLCKRNCPEGAIEIVNNLAVIDYEKCKDCGKCSEICPVKCIKDRR